MSEKDIQNKLRREFEKETPDLLPRIKNACESTPQNEAAVITGGLRKNLNMIWRIAAVAACLVFFFSGLAIGNFALPKPQGDTGAPATPNAESIVYIDVNPSVEMAFDSEGRVISCKAGNEDAEKILENLELVGGKRNTALSAVLGAMYLGGYLSNETNSILISVDDMNMTVDVQDENEELENIADEINRVFAKSNMECSIIAQRMDVTEELRARADAAGVSVGKQYLVDKMVKGCEGIEAEDDKWLTTLSIGELSLIYSTRTEGVATFSGDVTSGYVGGFKRPESVILSILDYTSLAEALLESHAVIADYARIDGEYRMVYNINMKFKYTQNSYFFRVDCKTGDIIDSDFEPGFSWDKNA